MATIDLQNRAPSVTRTRDFRDIVERRYDVLNWAPKSPVEILAECWQPLGTVDAEYTECYLVDQKVEGQTGNYYEPCKLPPVLVRRYLQLDGLAETLDGEPAVTINQYGYREISYTYQQLSTGTAIYSVPGTTPAPAPYQYCLLRDQEDTDDGTLRTIKRVFIEGGLLDDVEEIKFNGTLILRTLTSLLVPPATPTGATLITQSIRFVNGAPLYSYGFADGRGPGPGFIGGEISRKVDYNLSPDQGATGVTVTTINWVTPPATVVNPITGPAGSQLISVEYADNSGYRTWTAIYAAGAGLVTQNKDIREGGKLIIYSRTSINTAPSTPGQTIGGTVTLIGQNQRNGSDAADGTVIYDYQWAEGIGEIDRATDYSESSDQGTTGVTRITVRALTALGGSNPVSTPSGTVLVSVDPKQQDGYILWTVTYAKGAGEVSRSFEVRYGAGQVDFTIATPNPALYTQALILCTVTSLTAASVTVDPSSAPTGTPAYSRIQSSHREADGWRVWTTLFASGTGVITYHDSYSNSGMLVTYRRTALNPTTQPTPTPTIGGVVNLVDINTRYDDTNVIVDYVWNEGFGVIDRRYQPHDGGLRLETWTSLGFNVGTAIYVPPDFIPPGVCVIQDMEQADGYTKFVASSMQGADGSFPTDYSYQTDAFIPFSYPGRARLFTFTITTNGLGYIVDDLFLSPPVTSLVRGTKSIEYQTSNVVPPIVAPFWNPTEWASLTAIFVGVDGYARRRAQGLEGYTAFPAGTATFFNGLRDGALNVFGENTQLNTGGVAFLTGGPTPPDGLTEYILHAEVEDEPAFYDVDGTAYYRLIFISAIPPAQAALPV